MKQQNFNLQSNERTSWRLTVKLYDNVGIQVAQLIAAARDVDQKTRMAWYLAGRISPMVISATAAIAGKPDRDFGGDGEELRKLVEQLIKEVNSCQNLIEKVQRTGNALLDNSNKLLELICDIAPDDDDSVAKVCEQYKNNAVSFKNIIVCIGKNLHEVSHKMKELNAGLETIAAAVDSGWSVH